MTNQTKLMLCPACNVFGITILLETNWKTNKRIIKCQKCKQTSEIDIRNWKI